MRVVVSEFMSLDGVVQAPGGPQEDPSGGFRHGGWSMPYFDPGTMGPVIGEIAERSDALLQGRRTYQVSSAAWPERAGDPFADWINGAQKYVVSDSLTEQDLAWKPTAIIRGADLVAKVSEMREKPGGDIYVYGSLSVVRALLTAMLVDELILMIEPIALGGGRSSSRMMARRDDSSSSQHRRRRRASKSAATGRSDDSLAGTVRRSGRGGTRRPPCA